MNIVSVSERQLKKMPELQIGSVVSTEGKLYVYDYKNKWQHNKELIKIYYNQKENYMADKINVISQLLANKKYLDMPEVVLPSSLVAVDKKISGYSMPWIEQNVNLSILLNNPKVSLYQKVRLLKDIYHILDKLMNIKPLEDKFFLGDIHEANFIIDLKEQIIKVIDIDSAYINNGYIGISKFLTFNDNLYDLPSKYPMNEDDRPIPNKNTTNLCFIYMLLNALSGATDVYRWSLEQFYNYMSYLSKKGMPQDLVDLFIKIYEPTKDNNLNIEMLDEIDVQKDFSLKRML